MTKRGVLVLQLPDALTHTTDERWFHHRRILGSGYRTVTRVGHISASLQSFSASAFVA